MNELALKILILRWVFFFDVLGFTILLINLLFSNYSYKDAIKTFIGAILIEVFILYVFLNVPIGCSIKILYKTPIISTYYFLSEVTEDKETPSGIRVIVKGVRFLLSTLISAEEENHIESLRKRRRYLIEIIDNIITTKLMLCYHLKT